MEAGAKGGSVKALSGLLVGQNLLLGGFRMIQSGYCTTRQQYRFPRSKRERIRRKWAQRERNFRHMPDQNMYVSRDQGAVIMHPATWRMLERELERRQK